MELVEKEISEHLNYEMATVQPKRSKLPYKVWLNDIGEKRAIEHNFFKLKYGPCFDNYVEIPFYEKKDIYSFIGKLKKGKIDMKPISKWINLNYDNLIKFYKQEEDYDFIDFISEMKSVD